MFSSKLNDTRRHRCRSKAAFGTFPRTHTPLLARLSYEDVIRLKATAFVFGISSANLCALYYIFRKYVTYRRCKHENNAIKQMNHQYTKRQNHFSSSSSKNDSNILFPAFLRPKYSENSRHEKDQKTEVILDIYSPSNFKEIDEKMNDYWTKSVSLKSKIRTHKIHNFHRRYFSDQIHPNRNRKLEISHSKFGQSNALMFNPNYKDALKNVNKNDNKNLKRKYVENNHINRNNNSLHSSSLDSNKQIWEERKLMNANNNVVQNDYKNMRFRQINDCFNDIMHNGQSNEILNESYEDTLNYSDFDFSHKQDAETMENEQYIRKSQSLKEYKYTNNYSYLNNNYDDDHLNLFSIHHFIERIMHKDQHGNVILRLSREWERPQILSFDANSSNFQLSFNSNYDAAILRYFVDIYYARFNIITKMMLDFKYFSSEFLKQLIAYFDAKKGDESSKNLDILQKEVYSRHTQLMLLKSDIYKHMISYCDVLRIPDELLLDTQQALALKEELLSEILPLYFLSGISDIPLQTRDGNIGYEQHLQLLYDYYHHRVSSEEENVQKQALDEYINIISRLLKLEDYDHFQSQILNDDNANANDINFNSYPKLALHLMNILECKYSENLFPRSCYRIIRTLCKKIELFGCYDAMHNELLRISLKKMALHSPDFFNNLSFYQLLSMTYVNIESGNKLMDNLSNKLFEMKHKMMGGQLNSADLAFLCNNESLEYWLKRVIHENDKNTNDSDIFLQSMGLNIPISVLGYDGILFVLLKYFDNLTYLNRDHVMIADKVQKIIKDILQIYENMFGRDKDHETLCAVLNFMIRKCAQYGNKSNGLKFGGNEMIKIMQQISEINIGGKAMIYDLNALKQAMTLIPDDIDFYLDSWWEILNKRNVKITANTWLMLALSNSISIVEKNHYSLFENQLKRKIKYEKKMDYRCLSNMQSDLCPIIFFNAKKNALSSSGTLRQSAQRHFDVLEHKHSINLHNIMIEGMLMNLNYGKNAYYKFCQKYNVQSSQNENDQIYKLFKTKLDNKDLFNMIPFFNNLNEIMPSDKFGMFEIGKLLTLLRKTKNANLSLSLFESLSFRKKYGNANNELLSILILTLIENGKLESAKYWIQRYMSCYPLLCAELIDNFFAHYFTYSVTATRSIRCQGRDRQILKDFYDDLIVHKYKDSYHKDANVSFDKLVLYALEYNDENLSELLSSNDIKLNTYKAKTECIEQVFIYLMRNNQIYEMTQLLKTLYLSDDWQLFDANIEIIVRSFSPILRFLANYNEYGLIKDLFKKFEEYNAFNNKSVSIPITTQKIEILFDDDCKNLPVLKDFECLKESEKNRMSNYQEMESMEDYVDPCVDLVNLWKEFYFNNRHTNKALMNKMYSYFVQKDKFLFDNSHFTVSKDVNVRFAHYFMMDVIYNERIFDEKSENTKRNEHFRNVLQSLLKEHYNDAYVHCHQFSKEQQNRDLQKLLRQL